MGTRTKIVVCAFVAMLAACGGEEPTEPTAPGAGAGGEQGDGEAGTDGQPGADTETALDEISESEGEGAETDENREEGAVMVNESGAIAFRADVQMSLETLPGTGGEAAQKMGGAVQRRMTKIRGCYDDAVANDPEIQGVLKLLLETNARGVLTADVTEAGLERGRITDCVLRILRRLPRRELPRRARLWVVLRATNTMAEGARRVREAREAQGGQ